MVDAEGCRSEGGRGVRTSPAQPPAARLGARGRRTGTKKTTRLLHVRFGLLVMRGRDGIAESCGRRRHFPTTTACSEVRSYKPTVWEPTRGTDTGGGHSRANRHSGRTPGCTPGEIPLTSGATTHPRRREIPTPHSTTKAVAHPCGRAEI